MDLPALEAQVQALRRTFTLTDAEAVTAALAMATLAQGTAAAGATAPPKRKSKSALPLDRPLVQTLAQWRWAEARRRKVSAFVVLLDRQILALEKWRPQTRAQLIHLKEGKLGMTKVERYADELLQLIRTQEKRDMAAEAEEEQRTTQQQQNTTNHRRAP